MTVLVTETHFLPSNTKSTGQEVQEVAAPSQVLHSVEQIVQIPTILLVAVLRKYPSEHLLQA